MAWRRYSEGDEDIPDVVIAGAFEHDGPLDPSLPVVARFDVVPRVVAAHRRFYAGERAVGRAAQR